MIKIESLVKYYNEFKALDNISFEINQGDIVGLLGPNGAGKTTTMRIITGYLSYDSGEVKIGDLDPQDKPLEVKKIIGYLPENPLLYDEMTVFEFLKFICELKNVKEVNKEIERVIEITKIGDKKNQIIGTLSKGYKQRVGLSSALISDPPILILDEPTSGLDPNQIIEIRDVIKKMRKSKTIILSTHILPEVEEVCNKVILIDKGTVKAIDSIEGIKNISQGRPSIIIKCDDNNKLKNVLSKIDYITEIEEKESEIEVFIKNESYKKELLETLVANKTGVYEFYSPKISLEDVFHRLTIKEGDNE
ncbi:MAG TPA: ABC transporter ATP-binding protein [Spirochaetota bacterium]|nr:ABC transporter ATP-binding protein [Spirochaetota bacterium]HOM38322.1 ABC transporter ATP-binding protein [Spirochaetota bacterium]HPQ48460.1 ABC transporter ATP-binding protein [Spirochaetota bacterium]